MPHTKTLLIDLDGTLVDSLEDLAASVNFTLARLGHPSRTMEEVRGFVGHGVAALLAKALGEGDDRLQEARELFFAHYDDHLLDRTRLFAGWEKVLAAPVNLVCATNKPERFARKILEGLGLTQRFALLVGGDTLPVKKPDPAVAEHVRENLGASELVMVGDGVPDGALAQACGIPFWGASWGYSTAGELAPYQPVWLSRPEDILDLVGNADAAS